MSLTEQQKEIALRVAGEISVSAILDTGDSDVLEFATRFLAALPKPKPVGKVDHGRYRDIEWLRQPPPSRTLLYTEAPIAPPASEQKPKQPWPNHNWCLGCSPENCSGCGTEPIERRAPQPEYKVQRDAERYRWLRDGGMTLSWRDSADGKAEFPCCRGGDLDAAIDAAIASVKGGA